MRTTFHQQYYSARSQWFAYLVLMLQCGCLLVDARQACAQGNIQLPAPHEKVQNRSRYDPVSDGPKELSARKPWKMVDGAVIEGVLLGWIQDPEVVLLQDFSQTLEVPLRAFAESDRAEVEKLLGAHRDLIAHLQQLPGAPLPSGVKLAQEDQVRGAVLDIKDGFVYWTFGEYFWRTPTSHYGPADLEKLQRSLKTVNQPLWQIHSTHAQVRGELLGQVRWAGDRTAFIVKVFAHPSSFHSQGLEVLIPKDLLALDDQHRALDELRTKGLEKPIRRDQAPQLWWPMLFWQEPVGKPIALKGLEVTIQVPQPQADADGFQVNPPQLREWQNGYPNESTFPIGYLLVQELLEEDRVRKLEPNITDEKLASAMRQFTDKIIASNPYIYLSPEIYIRVREARQPLQARLVAASGPYWLFEQFSGAKDPVYVAVPKSELTPQTVVYGERVLKDLERFFAAHPEAKQVSSEVLQTKNRLLRRPFMNLIVEPKSINDDVVELSIQAAAGPQPMLQPLKQTHFKDREEFRVVLGSAAETNQPATNPSMKLNDPAARDRALANSQLKSALARTSQWTLSAEGNESPDEIPVFLQAALQGEYQDSLVFVGDNMTYLVDPDILSDRAREQADRQLRELAALRQRSGVEARFNLPKPPLRLYGQVRTTYVIGSRPRYDGKRGLSYQNSSSQEQLITPHDTSMVVRFECELQSQLDREFRSRWPAQLNDQQLQEAKKIKQRLRVEKRSKIETALREETYDSYSVRNHFTALTGRFIKFDQDDAIFKIEDGRLVRVYKVAFHDESLLQMQERDADPEYRQRVAKYIDTPSAEVQYRVIRAMGGGLHLPVIPVSVEAELVVVRMGNSQATIPIETIHPRDVSEMRGELYRRARGLQRDETIDEQLRQAVAEKDVIYGPFKLENKWKEKLDILLKPRKLVWETRKLALSPNEQVLSFSPDASRILVAPKIVPLEVDHESAALPVELKVVELANGKAQSLKGHYLPGTRAYLSRDNGRAIVFAKNTLKVVDLSTSKVEWETSELRDLPLASCQSGDGENIVALQSDSSLRVVSIKHRLVARIENTEVAIDKRRQVWSSQTAEHVAALVGKELRSFRRPQVNDLSDKADAQDRQAKFSDSRAHVVQSVGMNRPVIALGSTTLHLINQNTPTCYVMDPVNGVFAPQQLPTGLNLMWIAMGADAKPDRVPLHLIGKRTDPLAQSAPYYFSAYFSGAASVRYATQTLEAPLDRETLFDLTGAHAIYKQKDEWWLASEAALTRSVLQPLAGIAEELVATRSWGQVDAAWAYLRTKPFQDIAASPEEAAEGFLQTVYEYVNLFGWQHGGDLDARAEALLARWEKMSPDSVVVPTLLAMRERDLAWRARGKGFADTVTEEGQAEFEKRMLNAVEILKPLLKQADPPTRAYTLAYDAAMSLGMPLEVVKNLNRGLMQSNGKFSFSAHAAVVLYLLPRWHGNPGDSENYITEVADQLGGEIGDSMYARLILYMDKYYPNDKKLSEFVQYDAQRLVRGLKAFYKRSQSADYLQRALRIMALEEKWDLVRELIQLQTDARIYVDVLTTDLKTREQEAKQAFAEKK